MKLRGGLTTGSFVFFFQFNNTFVDKEARPLVYWFTTSDFGGDDASIQRRDARV